ncbi:amidase family protein [Lentzea kentuckyensis]|uniref:amidase family protein n=1 Tax=Lentzea kentuckyensis TaxID=360086 RepID=UPI000A372575|nr:amidase family protein [Lentzea kentuckyensis]
MVVQRVVLGVIGLVLVASSASAADPARGGGVEVDRLSIAGLQRAMDSGRLTSVRLTGIYLGRIATKDRTGPRAVIATNPQAIAKARESDARRAGGTLRGPLDGIPVLLKDNIGTGTEMPTTAGSLALKDAQGPDSVVARRLRDAGAVLLGKTNLAEWSDFRSSQSSASWSAIGGATENPRAPGRSPCGSSAGSAAAVAAGFAPVAVGTETDGSIVCPSAVTGLVGLKPTHGVVDTAGLVPISAQQDVAGPIARTAADAALVFDVLSGGRTALAPEGAAAVKGKRIGVWRAGLTGLSGETDAVLENAVRVLREAGAVVVDQADVAGVDRVRGLEFAALLCEFEPQIGAYLSQVPGDRPKSLTDLIAFNRANADAELRYFGQEIFEWSAAAPDDPAACHEARSAARTAAKGALDTVLDGLDLDLLMAPTTSPARMIDLVNGDHPALSSATPAAVAGYPSIAVPAGDSFGLPIGVTFTARPLQDAKLLAAAHAFGQAAGPFGAASYPERT